MIGRLRALRPDQLLLVLAGLAVLVGLLSVLVPVLADVGMLLAAAGLLAAVALLAQWIWQSQRATDWTNSYAEPRPQRGSDSRINRLVLDISQAGSGGEGGARLHHTLHALAVERLRDHRGLSLDDDDPAAREMARDALGPDLTAYLDGPPTAPLASDRLAQFTTTLEDL